MTDRKSQTIRIELPPVAAGGAPDPGERPAAQGRGNPPPNAEYQQLLNAIYDGAIIASTDGWIMDSNIRARDFLLFSRDELYRFKITELLSGADAGLLRRLKEYLQDEHFVLIQAHCLRRDGSYFPAEIAVNLLRQPEPRLCFFIRDITDRLRLEESQRKLARQQAMLASVGAACHHLAQPATVVLTTLELLRKGVQQGRALAPDILDESLAAANQIREILLRLQTTDQFKTIHYLSKDQDRDSPANVILRLGEAAGSGPARASG